MSNEVLVQTHDLNVYWDNINTLGAKSEVDIIRLWIERTCSNSENTLVSYLKEMKRFLIFCDSIGKSFAEITTTDINDYLGILKNPSEQWLKPKNGNVTLKTQVLQSGLKLISIEHTQRVLNGFYSYIKEAGVVRANPVFFAIKINLDESQRMTGAALSFDAWDYLSDWLRFESMKANTPHNRSKAIRDRWLMHLMYYTGARRSSISVMNMNCFSLEEHNGKRHWMVNFLAKGSKKHKIVAVDQLIEELVFYRKSLGLTDLPESDESHIPVVPAVNLKKNSILTANKSISNRGINYVIEECLKRAYQDCEDHYIANELLNTTPHTFRHTCATHWLTLGVDVVATQKHLGHANLNTTMIYMQNINEHRIKEAKKLSTNYAERDKRE